MERQRKFPSPLYIGIIIFLGFLFSIASAVFISTLATTVFPQIQYQIYWQKVLTKLVLIVGELNLFLFAVIFLFRRTSNMRQLFRIHAIPAKMMAVMFPLGVALAIAGDALDRLMQLIIPASDVTQQLATMLKANSPMELGLLIIGSVLVAPVVEEFLFRGALQQALEETIGVTRAVIYASLLWAIIHGVMNWAIQIFVLGVFIGYVAWRLNSTVASIILHAINNLLAVIFYNWDIQSILPYYEWHGQVNPIYTVIAVGIIYGVIRWLELFYRSSTSVTDPSS